MTPLGIAATVVILLPVAVVLVVSIVWWVKNVGRHRIPRPFLGDGPNVEWAEMKKAELATGKQRYGPAESHSIISLADVIDGLESKNALHARGSKENGRVAPGSLPQEWRRKMKSSSKRGLRRLVTLKTRGQKGFWGIKSPRRRSSI